MLTMNEPDVAGSAKEGPTTSWSGSTSPITVGLLGVQDWSAGDVGFDGGGGEWNGDAHSKTPRLACGDAQS